MSQGLADAADVSVGDRVRLGLLTQEEFESFDEGFGLPDGPTVDLEVVGTFTVGGNDSNEQVGILGSPAFAEVADGRGGGDGADGPPRPTSRAPWSASRPGCWPRRRTSTCRRRGGARGLRPPAGRRGPRSGARRRRSSWAGACSWWAPRAFSSASSAWPRRSSATRPAASAPRPCSAPWGLDRRQRSCIALAPFALVTAPVAAVTTVAGRHRPLAAAAHRVGPQPGALARRGGQPGDHRRSASWLDGRPGPPRRRPSSPGPWSGALPPRRAAGVSLAARGAATRPAPAGHVGGSLALDRGREWHRRPGAGRARRGRPRGRGRGRRLGGVRRQPRPTDRHPGPLRVTRRPDRRRRPGRAVRPAPGRPRRRGGAGDAGVRPGRRRHPPGRCRAPRCARARSASTTSRVGLRSARRRSPWARPWPAASTSAMATR